MDGWMDDADTERRRIKVVCLWPIMSPAGAERG